MKKRIVHIRKAIIASIFLLIIGGIVVNSTFFLHAHKNESGKIVFHAHPFDKGAEQDDPLAEHKHKRLDLDLFSSIGYFVFLIENIDFSFKIEYVLELLGKPCTSNSSYFYLGNTSRGSPQPTLFV